MMRVGPHGEYADAARLVWATECRCESRAARSEGGHWSKAGTEAGRAWDKGRDAGGTCVLGYREGAVVLYKFFRTGFKDDAVVVDSVAAAKDCFACAIGIPGEAYAWAEVFLVRRLLEVDDVCHPCARVRRLRCQIGAWLMSA